MTRYAIYFAPGTDSSWWKAGCRWLGRDPESGAEFPQAQIAGISNLQFARLTADARRYGLHATLKPPFRLMEGFDETHLETMVRAFAAVQNPVHIPELQVGRLGEFLALRPAEPSEALAALALRCVSYFDLLRAPPTAAELDKRRRAGLSQRQEALLQRWGYPFTEEEFRFHLTLTDALADVDPATVQALERAAKTHFATARAGAPLWLDGLTVFREEHAGAPFSVWKRFPFCGQEQTALPSDGRLFFCVGPSGVGKDALLRWVEQRLPASLGTVFARRTITRPEHASEDHDAVDAATFRALAEAGHFALRWQANDLCYGIRRGIEADLKAGRDVVVNGSREYIPQLRRIFPQAQVIWVEADAAQIRARMEARQREAGPALLQRLDRNQRLTSDGLALDGEGIVFLDNSGALEVAGQRLLGILAG